MNRRQLQLLVALGEHRNLARVAAQLNVTPPAVSKSLQDIERALDAELFQRGPRGVTPTLFGECMVRHAQVVLAQLDRAAAELRALRNGSLGSVAVGVLPAAAPLLVPLAIARLKREAPLTTVSLRDGTTDSLFPALRAGRLDIVVGTLPPPQLAAGLALETLYEDDVVAVSRTGHPLARKRRLAPTALPAFPWIIPPGGTSMGESFRELLARLRLPMPRNYVESSSIVVNKTLIQRSDVVGFFSRHIAELYAEQRIFAVLDLELDARIAPVGAMWAEERPLSPSAELALACLRREAPALDSR